VYAEYYAGNTTEDWELAITFEATEEWQYTAYITGLPYLKWKEQSQSWELWEFEIRPEIPREVQGTRVQTKRASQHVHKRMLQLARDEASGSE